MHSFKHIQGTQTPIVTHTPTQIHWQRIYICNIDLASWQIHAMWLNLEWIIQPQQGQESECNSTNSIRFSFLSPMPFCCFNHTLILIHTLHSIHLHTPHMYRASVHSTLDLRQIVALLVRPPSNSRNLMYSSFPQSTIRQTYCGVRSYNVRVRVAFPEGLSPRRSGGRRCRSGLSPSVSPFRTLFQILSRW